jgi:hypothetical protein
MLGRPLKTRNVRVLAAAKTTSPAVSKVTMTQDLLAMFTSTHPSATVARAMQALRAPPLCSNELAVFKSALIMKLLNFQALAASPTACHPRAGSFRASVPGAILRWTSALLLQIPRFGSPRAIWYNPCLILGEVSSAFLPSEKACWAYQFRYLGVGRRHDQGHQS